MSKKTLYGQTHNRIVTPLSGVRAGGEFVDRKALSFIKTKRVPELISLVWKDDTYHKHLMSSKHAHVRAAVARSSTKYHGTFVNDEHWVVRLVVALASTKYHGTFVNDEHWRVRLAVAEASTTYHEQLKDDEDGAVSAAAKNYKEK